MRVARPRGVRRLLALLAVSSVAAATLVFAPAIGIAPAQSEAHAADASQFRAGNLISDQNFYNGSALTTEQVQAFLNARVPSCRAGYTCLKDYAAATPSRPAESGNCAAYAGSSWESAASIITRVGQACGISQKAMLVLLEKEQGIVSDSWPTDRQYRSATGYGCPDTADCDSSYYGFFNQVYMAALQLKRYAANPTRWKHVAGRTNSILFHPNSACGSSSVFIENTATAGLYNYTPYQPNAAALANLYGTGDGCSAYGNRNFWRIYTDWFGSPTGAGPKGAWNTVSGDGGVTVTGWVAYPDAPTAVGSAIVQIGSNSHTLPANGPSPGVNGVIPGAGDNHGFAGTIPTPPGDYFVCVSASTRSGGQSLLGCLNLTVYPAPVAEWTTSHGDGGVTVSGWAVYPNAQGETARVSVAVGPTRFTLTADKPSDAAAARFPGAGRMHGYSGTVPAPPGTHPVCVYVTHRSVGESLVGCLSQTVTQGPISEWSTSSGAGGAIRVTGWSFYPDAPAATVPVSVDIDGTRHAVSAGGSSPGLDARYPGVGDRHGYTAAIPATVGDHRVCVYSKHRSVGETLLGCLTQYVEPVRATAEWSTSTGVGGAVQVSGWAFYTDDPTRAVSAAVYIDGVRTLVTANRPSPGLDAKYPGAGDNHGYRASIPAAAGNHRVCVSAVHPTAGETLLGCLTQTVTTGPVAEWSTSTGTAGTVTVTGWAFHPDARTETATVAVSIDGVRHPISANQPSPGLDAKYPGTGDNHGYTGAIPATAGNHNVCVYVHTRAGAEQLVGCLTQNVEP